MDPANDMYGVDFGFESDKGNYQKENQNITFDDWAKQQQGLDHISEVLC